MPRSRQNVPANETSSQRFIRLANDRVSVILKNFKALGKLGGTTYYSTPDQRKQINTALTEALARTMQSMEKGDSVQEFKLK